MQLRSASACPNHHRDNCSQWDNWFPLHVRGLEQQTWALPLQPALRSSGETLKHKRLVIVCWFKNSLYEAALYVRCVSVWALLCVCVCALGERRHACCVAVCEPSESVSACKCAQRLCFYSEDYSSFRRHVLPSPVSNPVDVSFFHPSLVCTPARAESFIEREIRRLSPGTTNARLVQKQTLKHLQAELKSIRSLNPGHDLWPVKICLWRAAAGKIRRHIDRGCEPAAAQVNICFCLKNHPARVFRHSTWVFWHLSDLDDILFFFFFFSQTIEWFSPSSHRSQQALQCLLQVMKVSSVETGRQQCVCLCVCVFVCERVCEKTTVTARSGVNATNDRDLQGISSEFWKAS